MKLKNLFAKFKSPKKDGNAQNSGISNGSELSYFIQFSNLENTPIFELNDMLVVGRESGDCVFNDDSLSPKHCTIFLNQGVVSVVDHNSEMGTFVSEHQVEPGKQVILKDEDFIRAGELEIDIVVQEKEASPNLEMPTLDSPPGPIAPPAETPAAEAPSDDLSLGEPAAATSDELSLSEPEPAAEAPGLSLDSTQDIEIPDDLNLDDPTPPPQVSSEVTQDIQIPDELAEGDDLSDDEVFEEFADDEPQEKKKGLLARILKLKSKEEKAAAKAEKLAAKEEKKRLKEQAKAAKLAEREEKKGKGKDKKSDKKKDKKKDKKEKKSKIVDPDDLKSLNPLSRGLALFADAILTYAIYDFIVDRDEITSYFPKITDFIVTHYDKFLAPHLAPYLTKLEPHLAKYPQVLDYIKMVGPYLDLIYLYLAFRIVTTLLFGASLGQVFLRIQAGKGNFIWKRLGGVLREIFGVILLPLIVLDFMVLLSKRSIKEIITFTKLQTPSKGAALSGIVLGFPFVVILLILSPLFHELKLPKEIRIQTKTIKIEPLSKVGVSHSHQLLANYIILENDVETILPDFMISSLNGKRVVNYKYTFFNNENPKGLRIDFIGNEDISQMVEDMAMEDLMLDKNFPLIKGMASDAAKVNENFQPVKYVGPKKDQFIKELMTYTKAAFALDLSKIHEHIMKYGPFLKGYVEHRRKILKKIGYSTPSQLTHYQIGKSNFLVYKKRKGQYAVFVLDSTVARAFDLNFDDDAKAEKLITSFLMKFEFLTEKMELAPLEEKDTLTAFESLDYFSMIESGEVSVGLLLDKIFDFYYSRARMHLEAGNMPVFDYIKSIVKRFVNVVKVLNESFKTEEDPEPFAPIVQKLTELLQAMEEKNMAYFGLDQGPPEA